MKIIIISNCQTQAYYNYMTGIFPDWDVRSATHVQAGEWLDSRSEPFLKFLEEADIFIGLPVMRDRVVANGLNSEAVQIVLPSFTYEATRPDCIWLQGIPAPLGSGIVHSKIAAAAFSEGKSVKDTAQLFTGNHFAEIGYFSQYNQRIKNSINAFKKYDLDISEALTKWQEKGDFMYMTNHPESQIIFDIAHMAMRSSGFNTNKSDADVHKLRNGFNDYLAKGNIWPVYPEIAEEFKVINSKSNWCTNMNKNGRIEFGLEEMLQRSFSIYEMVEKFKAKASKALGGDDEIRQLAGV